LTEGGLFVSNPILAHALEALWSELSVIPIEADGSKKPRGRWKLAQSERSDELSLRATIGDTPGYGVVCGAVSQRLVCIDMEGRFIEAQMIELLDRLERAGMADVWATLTQGYMVQTPTGGWHVPFHLIGDGEVPGNEKLAFAADGQVLIETRGEGGYFVGHSSCGGVHRSGKPWELFDGGWNSIEWITPEQWDLLKRVFVSFNARPVEQPKLRLVGSGERSARGPYRGPSMQSILSAAGWSFVRDERAGELWRHPQATNEHSARINSSGRLYVWSGLPVVSDGTNQTFDECEVALMLDLGRYPSDQEMGRWLGQWNPAESRSPGSLGGTNLSDRAAVPPPADDSLYLPEWFWQARPYLSALFDAACGRRLSPDGVFGALLTAYATTVPMALKIPAIIGAPSVLNIYSALVAESGGGKTASIALAHELLGWNATTNRDVIFRAGLRSGEGLVDLGLKPPPKGTKPEDYEPSYRNAVGVEFDEGATLSAQNERSGATMIPYLNTAWAGSGSVGGALASGMKSFPADLVRVCVTMGVQFGAAASLFTGQSHIQGFPQRFGYFGLRSPLVGALGPLQGSPPAVQPLGLPWWKHSEFGGKVRFLEYDDAIQQDVRDWQHAKDYGAGMGDPYDHHRMLIRLRWAGVLALMDGETKVSADVWGLSSALENSSRSQRARLVSSISTVAAEKARAAGRMDHLREQGREDSWLEGKAKRLGRIVGETGETNFAQLMKARFSSEEKKRRQAILDYAVAMGWVIHRDGRVSAGPSAPRG
jgi:hypothetical protein